MTLTLKRFPSLIYVRIFVYVNIGTNLLDSLMINKFYLKVSRFVFDSSIKTICAAVGL